jgi:nitroreductase/NAD-dependent dihydropyrimidine dehydrogenase PreA subunit
MAIPTSRTKVKAEIIIEKEKCSGCGLCVTVCKDFGLEIKEKKAGLSGNSLFGCIACGHCMAVCPNGAIKIRGRELSEDDLLELPAENESVSFENLNNLFVRRRSIREFKDKPVEKEIIEKILTAASFAPMGLPPTDVNVLVINGKKEVRKFAEDFCALLEKMKWFFSPWFIKLFGRFLMGKKERELFDGFVIPAFNAFIEHMKKGNNIVNYDAPVMLYFYGTEYSDPADPIIAATYAMTAAESLGLGTCMLGAMHPMLQNGKEAEKFRSEHGIKNKSREGLFLILGYPAVKYNKGLHRTFASVEYSNN